MNGASLSRDTSQRVQHSNFQHQDLKHEHGVIRRRSARPFARSDRGSSPPSRRGTTRKSTTCGQRFQHIARGDSAFSRLSWSKKPSSPIKGHGLLQRDRSRYTYRLTQKGGPSRAALSFTNSSADHRPTPAFTIVPTTSPTGQQTRSHLSITPTKAIQHIGNRLAA
jgi:hypothetical protein